MNGVVAEKQDGAVDGKEDGPVAEFGPGNVASVNEAAGIEAYGQVAANWAELVDMPEVEIVFGHELVGDPVVGYENVGLQHDTAVAAD